MPGKRPAVVHPSCLLFGNLPRLGLGGTQLITRGQPVSEALGQLNGCSAPLIFN
jgi:hypothetical protein